MPKNAYQKQVWNTVKAFIAKTREEIQPIRDQHKLTWECLSFNRVYHDMRKDHARVKISGVWTSMRDKIVAVGAMLDWLEERNIPFEDSSQDSVFHAGLIIRIPPEERR